MTTDRNRSRASSELPGGIPGEILTGLPVAPIDRLRARFVRLRRLHAILTDERHSRGGIPLRTRVRALRLGFSSRSWVLYDLDHNDPADYLPDWAELDFGLAHKHLRALNDKLLFARAMTAIDLLTPRPHAFIARGRLHTLDGHGAPDSRTWLAELTKRLGDVVLKPVSGASGRGIIFLRSAGGGIEANGVATTPMILEEIVSRLDQYLVTEFVRQAQYAETIFAESTNTLRILTLWDPAENRPFLAAGAHRVGCRRGSRVDNFHGGLGGLSVPIDLATGTLGRAVALIDRVTLRRYERHPLSGALIEGVLVPRWQEVTGAVLRAAASLPEAPFVGWDLVATDRGPCFLEGNAPPSPWVWQVHGGLLRDPRTRAFFESQGLITRRRAREETA